MKQQQAVIYDTDNQPHLTSVEITCTHIPADKAEPCHRTQTGYSKAKFSRDAAGDA